MIYSKSIEKTPPFQTQKATTLSTLTYKNQILPRRAACSRTGFFPKSTKRDHRINSSHGRALPMVWEDC
jgi:hypothetical protein